MKSFKSEFTMVAAVAALLASMSLAHAQGSAGGTGAAGSTTSTPSGTNVTQPARSAGSMSSSTGTKSKAATQDCRDHANTATGQKRNDAPQSADTDKACNDMMDNSSMKKSKKSMTGATSGQPAPASN